MSVSYKVTITNRSQVSGEMCIYQKQPNQPSGIFSLVWFKKACRPYTAVSFRWETDYQVLWAETGKLEPGVTFEALQCISADPYDTAYNSFGFSCNYGSYEFTNTAKRANPGTIGIFSDGSIPNSKASISMGMSGEPVFAAQALMNYDIVFVPNVRYYLVFGSYREGEVLNLSSISNAFAINFPANVFERKIELTENQRFIYTE